MKRKISQYEKSSPAAMARMSEAAIFYAFEDSRADILELNAENQRLRVILRQIAYPRRGTAEESMTLQGFADTIQATYTLEQLEAEVEND